MGKIKYFNKKFGKCMVSFIDGLEDYSVRFNAAGRRRGFFEGMRTP